MTTIAQPAQSPASAGSPTPALERKDLDLSSAGRLANAGGETAGPSSVEELQADVHRLRNELHAARIAENLNGHTIREQQQMIRKLEADNAAYRDVFELAAKFTPMGAAMSLMSVRADLRECVRRLFDDLRSLPANKFTREELAMWCQATVDDYQQQYGHALGEESE